MENTLHAAKHRGRPIGSKNKRKEPEKPSVGMKQDDVDMQLKVLEIAAGSDVISAVADFASRYKLDVSVISTHGLVRDPTIYQPKPLSQMPCVSNYKGIFNLLSLKGNFCGSMSFGTRSSPFSTSHLIFFANREGNSVAGIVAGGLLAATKVILGVAIMRETDFIKLPLSPPSPSPCNEVKQTVSACQPEVCSSARGSMTANGVPYLTPTGMCSRIANGYLCACAIK